MNKFTKFVKDFWQDEEGLSVVEYVVGAGLLVTALGVIFSGWGTTLQTQLNNIFTSTGS
ncbi:Flp family type IVb pilin [Vibrio fluvialis]|jgi:pilus assembly protein Flp/PilA|uniref:Flp family type IVb pilin n=1 Tax=Vibrio fluvialis TaxID=676 RepID=UPI00192C8224|nr:Flp family type IVb pilin [Vibrio fluvialis]MBL4247584.1 Flp family type IVb pilin [Vibrio fluvialis]MBL4256060.1 Flp family type IVb pilin [Vibrio fluvialis]MBY7808949.1 Flp family type IVb pilin [Vibrio fluvialis]MBY7859344.1 Flp family type IVb pilin [Vibrio fluvialis]MBY8255619.1 Flp family type IVb pilin [Vibrio fluvialis]